MIEELWSGLIAFSAQFVVPDWGKLIELIPILLAGLVFLYLAWIVYRFATAGPTRRGMRRMPPATPAGTIHMPGPSFAPMLAAVGGVLPGLRHGGRGHLAVGGPGHPRDHAPVLGPRGDPRLRPDADTGAAGHVAAGALPAPAGTPPAGVHMPPPSFRPVLVSIGFTVLVASLVIGGWALIFGFLAVAVTAIGWLWDSRREYAATERADRTGHLDLGGAPAWPKATFAALAVIVGLAVLISSGILAAPGTGRPRPAPSPEPARSPKPAALPARARRPAGARPRPGLLAPAPPG